MFFHRVFNFSQTELLGNFVSRYNRTAFQQWMEQVLPGTVQCPLIDRDHCRQSLLSVGFHVVALKSLCLSPWLSPLRQQFCILIVSMVRETLSAPLKANHPHCRRTELLSLSYWFHKSLLAIRQVSYLRVTYEREMVNFRKQAIRGQICSPQNNFPNTAAEPKVSLELSGDLCNIEREKNGAGYQLINLSGLGV